VSADGPPRLSIGVIGVGRLGGVLAAAWERAGHHVVQVSAVSDVSRLRAEALLPKARIVDVTEVSSGVDLVLVAVPDDVLPGLLRGLAEAGVVQPGQFWVHPAGRYGLEVLEPVTAVGAVPLAIHPVMTFTGTSVDLERLVGCPFGVTAPEAVRTAAEALVLEAGGEPVWVPDEARIRYHAALAFGANSLSAIVNEASEMLLTAGIAEPQRLLAPLLQASLDNALRFGDQALTGPVARGDAESVAAHLESIAAVSRPAADAYRALARLIADRAVAAGLIDLDQAAALLGVLQEENRCG
jgi:predicted short-subunit dehydrogenase-like oxidoreductase (DUF2520 family)